MVAPVSWMHLKADEDEMNAEPAPRKKKGGFSVSIDYDAIRSEPWIAELNKKLNEKRFQLDPSILDELHEIASHRTVLPVVRTKADLELLQAQNARCLADRDRVTEILLSYQEIKGSLDQLWEASQARILEFPTFQRLTNQPAREAFMTAILPQVHIKRNVTEMIITMATTLQEHMTATDYSLTRHAKMGESMLNQRSA